MSIKPMTREGREGLPFVCVHVDPRCLEDPCPWGIARVLCNAPADHPARTAASLQEDEVGRG